MHQSILSEHWLLRLHFGTWQNYPALGSGYSALRGCHDSKRITAQKQQQRPMYSRLGKDIVLGARQKTWPFVEQGLQAVESRSCGKHLLWFPKAAAV